MAYSEYRDLTPIDNVENGDKYIEALEWAFQNKRIKNIALTGPYGAGKSSVIETFLAKDEKKHKDKIYGYKNTIKASSLQISMATFLRGECSVEDTSEGKIKINADEVEKGILKQLFYKVEPNKIPQSRYRKLHKKKFLLPFMHTIIALLAVTLLGRIFFTDAFDEYTQQINNFLPFDTTPIWITALAIFLLYTGISLGVSYLYCNVFSKYRVKEVKLPTETTVQKVEEEESVFNKNLDEIIYFFEATDYRTVFFEDLDRLEDPKIFVHLRELNNLLNNDDVIKRKPIRFVYAVRDDIFAKKDRTKFFDFIVPIIPVINSTNSGEILLQRLEEAKKNGIKHEISQEFVLDIAPFISDMRVLQNIYNEFVIYKDTLRTSQDLRLSDEQMFAMIAFKNLYPGDFSDIQNEAGIVKTAFLEKNNFIANQRNTLQKEIDKQEEILNQADKDTMISVKELKYAMFGTLIGTTGEFRGFCSYSGYSPSVTASTIMKPEYNMEELLQNDYKAVNYYNSGSSRYQECTKDDIYTFVNRWRALNKIEIEGIEKITEYIQELRHKQHILSGMTLKMLLETYNTENVLTDEVRKNKLLIFLFRRGYIDEKYANYINYFKGTSITKDDMNFILSVKNREPLPFNYQLTKTAMVINRLQQYEFEEKSIYNFDLLEQLIELGNSSKLETFVKQLTDENETSWQFIEEFTDQTTHKEQFLYKLTEQWKGIWKYISKNTTLTYERKLEYLREIIGISEVSTIESMNIDRCLSVFFEQHDDILQKLYDCESEKIASIIESLDVHFISIITDGVSRDLLSRVYDGCFYEMNEEMIRKVVAFKDKTKVSNLNEQPYSTVIGLNYEPLKEYIQTNIEEYISNIVLKHEILRDDSVDIIDLLKRLKGSSELQLKLIKQEDFTIDSLDACAKNDVVEDSTSWKPVWDELLSKDSILVNWENIISYWNIYKTSEALVAYIQNHVDELVTKDRSAVDDAFIKDFINADLDSDIYKKLLPVLRMTTFDLEISEIDSVLLSTMIDCKYFEFSPQRYAKVSSISEELGNAFIIENQDEYMMERNSISMTSLIFEDLICNVQFQTSYREKIFEEYAESYMTPKVALRMKSLNLPVTKSIFAAACSVLDSQDQIQVFLENCSIFDASDLVKKFNEIGGAYKELTDRSRQHVVRLPLTEGNRTLANRLEEIGYITSQEEKTETEFDPVAEKEKTLQILKLRIKKV